MVRTSPANVNDAKPAIDLIDAMPKIHGRRGRPREKPEVAMGDRAYGTQANIAACLARGIFPMLARPRSPHCSGLGQFRWVVERTMAWFGNYRRLKICYERTGQHFQALHELTASLICAKRLRWT